VGEEGRIRERHTMTKQKAKRKSTKNNDGMVDARRNCGTRTASGAWNSSVKNEK